MRILRAWFLAAAAGALTIALAGCPGMGGRADLPVSQSLSPAAQNVQKAINEANITIAAAFNVVAQNVTEGILTKVEGQDYVGKLKNYAAKVDAAQALLKGGDILNAQKQSEILSRAVLALHKEIASRARAKQ